MGLLVEANLRDPEAPLKKSLHRGGMPKRHLKRYYIRHRGIPFMLNTRMSLKILQSKPPEINLGNVSEREFTVGQGIPAELLGNQGYQYSYRYLEPV